MGGGGGGFNPVKSVTAAVKTATQSVASAGSSIAHGDVVGAASSVGNAVNPVAYTEALVTGQSSSNSGATLASTKSLIQGGVSSVSGATGLSSSQIVGIGELAATGGASGLLDAGISQGQSYLDSLISGGGTKTPNAPTLPKSQASVFQAGSGGGSIMPLIVVGVGGALVFLLRRKK